MTLFKHCIRYAFSLAFPKAGKRSEARMPMTAMTTNSSMSVKASRRIGLLADSNFIALAAIISPNLFLAKPGNHFLPLRRNGKHLRNNAEEQGSEDVGSLRLCSFPALR